MSRARRLFVVLAASLGPFVGPTRADEAPIDFERDVAGVLVKNCLGCHNASQASGGLRLDEREPALAGGESGAALIAGDPDASWLIERVREGSMPPEGKGKRLSEADVATLARWTTAGLKWPAERKLSAYELTTESRAGLDWWSLQPLRQPEVPEVSGAGSAIDAFVKARLDEHGLDLAAEADRRTLVRRATFDLTGLPPTPAEVQAFLQDEEPGAYERLIDRLLGSPRYGERWARHWLDVVRFSESKGFERDRLRDNAWRYRDWVIDALNDDMPYDEFVRRQLAGDAIAPDDANAAVATGFLVTGANNDVGNGSELERKRERMDELDDFVSNATSALLGLTVGCARCHDHKFDPIPTRDYYRLAAVFSGVRYGERALATPREREERDAVLAGYDKQIAAVNEQLSRVEGEVAGLLGGPASPKRNEVAFEPVEARFVRIEIASTTDGSEACLDELEIYGADEKRNLASLAENGRATASSLLAGHAIHQIQHLNDGLYGNDHSWIAGNRGACWAQIELKQPAGVSKVVWGRDREGHYTDRVPKEYAVLVSSDGENWQSVARRPEPRETMPGEAARVERLRDERVRLANEVKRIEAGKAALPGFNTAWAVDSQQPEPTQMLKRGDVTTPGEAVAPGALSGVRGLSSDLCGAEASDPERRLALANWIASAQNPLTARVMVNRVWHYHFGAGLVENPSDFGFNGGRPSHPELLDWLAGDFVSHGWRLKRLHRQIMLSAAYRQAFRPAPAAAAEVDAGNKLLWRMNRRRLSAEEIRDAILFTAGSLDEARGGPSFRTFKYTDGNIPVFEPLEGEDRATWRRTIYRHVVRSQSVAFLDVFDCPDSSVMTAKRSQTTTPLQTLSLVNNDFVVRQSELLAERLRREAGDNATEQADRGARLIFNRPASDRERDRLGGFVERHGLAGLGRALWNANEFLYVD